MILIAPAAAQQVPSGAPVAAPQQVAAPAPPGATRDLWLYKGSDLPPDPAFTFGTLPNGVRYAVAKNGVPPQQVSVRIRIDAGSLMERDDERGYAHLLEHLAFRGSQHVPDGEAKRVWQRLGVTFGSDSNASTTFTNTVYKLDLPAATEAGLDESLKILSGMLDSPSITDAALAAERPVVLAEQRELPGPQMRFGDATRQLFFAGQPLADRSPIGNIETLEAATAASVGAFHERWYRPDRAVIVISGDMDPAIFERLIVKHFGSWQGEGPAGVKPDFGKPADTGPVAASTVEPALPPVVSMGVLRPWNIVADTIEFNQRRMIDQVAIRLINRRLESRARAGGSFISANASLEDISRSANATLVQIVPVGDDWAAAMRDVRATFADAAMTPPTQAEIDREVAEIDAVMKQAVATARVDPGARIADELIEAVDIGETVAAAEGSYGIFRGAIDKQYFTPALVQASSKKVFEGVTRAVVNTRTPDAAAQTKLAAALTEDVSQLAAARQSIGDVSIDRLPRLGKPGSVTASVPALTDPAIEQVTFANGVKLLLFPNDSETSKVYVQVRFGGGLNAIPSDRETPVWAGDIALLPSGVGDLGQEELDRLMGSRQISLEFAATDDAFALAGITTAADLPDQLRLMAAKLAKPRWDPNPVNRAKAVVLAALPGMDATPDAVLGRDLERLLHADDPRWGPPSRAAAEALTPASFRAFWEPILKSGPIEVMVYGDVERAAAVEAVAATFGAMAPRPADAAPPTPVRFPAATAEPVVRRHEGQPNQAAAVIAWPTGSGTAGITESRQLDIVAAVFRDRLFDQLRSQAGISYTPTVSSEWPVGMAGGGRILALGMLPPDKTDFFFDLARKIAADLVTTPITADELRRAVLPQAQLIQRMASGNTFWLRQTAGGTRDPARLAAVEGVMRDLVQLDPVRFQALAAKYLKPGADWSMVVLPSDKVIARAKDDAKVPAS
ncbi:M16 family metallopeptidase [Sphingomonas japonica]|nr:M16 family metallopeptidase [Sphingomonas japonica]